MKTSKTHTPHKLGANNRDPARHEHQVKNPSAESRDVRENRSTRKSKLVTSVLSQPSHELRTSRQLLARESDRPWAKSLAESSAKTSVRKPVSLKLLHESAATVFVAGTFNNWLPDQHALRRNAAGEWSIDLELEPGRHEYLFVADGCWLPDPNAVDRATNPFGGHNSVLVL